MNRKYRRKYLFEFAKEKTNYKNKFYNIVFHAEKDDICNLNLIETPERICDYNEEYYKLLELYTCGKYQEYIERCEQYLLKVPQDFQSIILLVKSYILLNKNGDWEKFM